MSRVRRETPRNVNNFNSISSFRKQFSQNQLQTMTSLVFNSVKPKDLGLITFSMIVLNYPKT